MSTFDFKITILITDGKSQDNVQEPAKKLRSSGVHVFAVGKCFTCRMIGICYYYYFFYFAAFLWFLGIKSADKNELAQISSQPSRDFTSFVGDFKLLNTLLPLVSPRVCSTAGGVYASDGTGFNFENLIVTEKYIYHISKSVLKLFSSHRLQTCIWFTLCLLVSSILSSTFLSSLLRGFFRSVEHSVYIADIWFTQVSLESCWGARERLCGSVCATVRPGPADHSRTTTGKSSFWRILCWHTKRAYL